MADSSLPSRAQSFRIFVYAFFVILALLIMPFAPLVAQTLPPQVTATPASAMSGSTVTLSGNGFPASTTGQVTWDDGTWLGTFSSDESGAFAVEVAVPPSASGAHVISATTDDGLTSAQTTFVVEQLEEPTPVPTDPPVPTEVPPPTGEPLPTEEVPAPAPYPVVGTNHSENSPDAGVVVDGDLATFWLTAPVAPDEAWLILDLGAALPISVIQWQLATEGTLSDVEILLSDDGATWAPLITLDGQLMTTGAWIEQPVNVWARYVQLKLSNDGDLSRLGGFAEVQVWPASEARSISDIMTPTPPPTAEPEVVAPEQTASQEVNQSAVESTTTGTVSAPDGAGVNCRLGPGLDSGIIAVLPSGTTVDITGPPAGDWVPVNCDGQDGFISMQFVTTEPALEEPATPTPSTSSPAEAVTPAAPDATIQTIATPIDEQTVSPAPLPGPSLSLPLRGAFYYPWFPRAWNQQGVSSYTDFQPSLGLYDSGDADVIAEHIADMQYGNIDVGIASWWGQDSYTDQRIPALLDAASGTGFTWTIYHEQEGFGTPSTASIRSDLEYVRDRYASDPAYLRIDGRFVVFVYGSGENCATVDRWLEANETVGAYLVLKVFSGYQRCANQPDSWHQYGPARSSDSHLPHSYTISPGFDKHGEEPRLSRDIERWRSEVSAMVASEADWQLISTFNEWGEGTAVESAVEWESSSGNGTYLDVLHTNGTQLPPPPATPTQAPEPTPAATPTPVGPLSFTPVADAEVHQDRPRTNFGSTTTLQIDNEPVIGTYLLFDVTGVEAPIQKATLRLWVVDETSNAPPVQRVEDTTWSEDGITWSNRPDASNPTDDKDEVVAGTWLEYDVTSLVSGNGLVSFALLAESRNGLDINSREADGNHPELVLQFGDSGPAPTVAPSPTSTTTPSTPPPPSGDTAILLAAGDISTCSNDGDEQTARILDREAGTIATLGDNAYNDGTAQQFRDCYDPTWGRHKDRTYPSPGNHDYNTEGATPYYDYFGPAAGPPGQGYYSYDLGSWHIISLNSEIAMSAGSAQEQWLRADLVANPATCTLAYWHKPLFSSSSSHGSQPGARPLYQALYEHGAEIVLVGHDHTYERFAPQTPDGRLDNANGIRQFVVGTGGRNSYELGSPEPNSEVRNSGTFGIIKLTLAPGEYSWEFLPVEGKSFTDSGSGICHDAPASATAETGSHHRATSSGTPPTAILADRSPRRVAGKWGR